MSLFTKKETEFRAPEDFVMTVHGSGVLMLYERREPHVVCFLDLSVYVRKNTLQPSVRMTGSIDLVERVKEKGRVVSACEVCTSPASFNLKHMIRSATADKTYMLCSVCAHTHKGNLALSGAVKTVLEEPTQYETAEGNTHCFLVGELSE